ncbi:TPA: hypothetical protein DIC38_03235 [Candidatus Nomurabacteria bacterium]|nr:MAG: hypothetical protein O210_OD1C00001G0136 [Parcubacteria bacterium RAAC4_OD1_1]HCY26666.1 hypothetical protein [Candidatus Nomurabacteria bacterium]
MIKPILVTGYVNPDLDAVAGSMAYSEFLIKKGIECIVGFLGEPHEEAKYILNRFNIKYPEQIENDANFEKVILVDASDLTGLENRINPDKVIEIIDHRKVNEADKFTNAKVQIELVGSACTLVAEKFIENKVNISKDSAILLCGAIISNTLNFKNKGVTTERDIKAFKYLNEIALLPIDFKKDLFESKSDLSGDKLKERIMGDLAWFNLSGKRVSIAQLEIVNSNKIISNRVDEIIDIFNEIKKDLKLDYIFLNLIELEDEKNFIITDDIELQSILEKILNIKFESNLAIRNELIMRKQIVPLFKDELEKIINKDIK